MSEFNDIGFDKSNDIGKAGEKFYTEYVKSKGFDVLDVSDDPYFQSIDVDIIVSNKKGLHLGETIKYQILNKEPVDSTLIDVKTDTVAGKTGNFYFEWIAHYKPGCFAVTRADKWIYIYWDPDKDAPSKMWSIDINSLRSAVVGGRIKPGMIIEYTDGVTLSGTVKEYRSQKDKRGKDPGMYAWRIPIGYLTELGIVKEIKL